MLVATVVAVVFASLALCLTYSHAHGNIDMTSAFAVFFVTTLLIALILPILFIIAFKDLKITRTKRDLLFGKIASAFIALTLLAHTISDMAYMTSGSFQVLRFFRSLVAIGVIVFAVIEILPSRTKVSSLLKNVANGCVPIYTALSILTLYFNPTYIPEYFKILYIIAYSALTLFFVYDFKWRLVKTNAKAYTAISSMAFTLPVIISLTSVVGFIIKNESFTQQKITVSFFEMIFVCALSFYALSKVFAVKATVKYIIEASQKRLEAKAQKEKQKQAEKDAMLAALNSANDNKENIEKPKNTQKQANQSKNSSNNKSKKGKKH